MPRILIDHTLDAQADVDIYIALMLLPGLTTQMLPCIQKQLAM